VARRRTLGYTLVELMVSITLGLIVTLAVIATLVTMGRQFSVLTANVSAQGSAQIAMTLLDSVGRSAGTGFYSNGALLCRNWNAWNGTAVVSNGAAFMPARIVDGTNATTSDRLVFTSASAGGALSVLPLMTAQTATNFTVSAAGGLALNDLAIVGVPGSDQPCTLFQVTAAPAPAAACGGNATACTDVTRADNLTYNPPVAATYTTNPVFGYSGGAAGTSPAVVSRVATGVGGFRQEAFAVNCNALVNYDFFTNPALIPACTASPLAFPGQNAIATDVVQMHAQYGISDAAVAGVTNDIVTAWVNATGAWAAPTPDEVVRIKAVRVVIVVRSKVADGANVTAASCTNGGGVVNTGPCSFEDGAAPVIDLSATAVPAGRNWRNYRYRVHTAIIPLRNAIWSD
jgi:type IV pilus assembly protein PilW